VEVVWPDIFFTFAMKRDMSRLSTRCNTNKILSRILTFKFARIPQRNLQIGLESWELDFSRTLFLHCIQGVLSVRRADRTSVNRAQTVQPDHEHACTRPYNTLHAGSAGVASLVSICHGLVIIWLEGQRCDDTRNHGTS
jgi:hypothetical protein